MLTLFVCLYMKLKTSMILNQKSSCVLKLALKYKCWYLHKYLSTYIVEKLCVLVLVLKYLFDVLVLYLSTFQCTSPQA